MSPPATRENPAKTGVSSPTINHTVNNDTLQSLPADLAGVVAAWADLPAAVRAGFLAMIEASKPAALPTTAPDKPEPRT